jgi:hypothetical protein
MKRDMFDIYSAIYLSTREHVTVLIQLSAVIFIWSAVCVSYRPSFETVISL